MVGGNLKATRIVLVLAAVACAANAPKSAAEYYSDAAYQYIENRLPTAAITCKEGLSYYPDDVKLQMLADRIDESKDEQKNQNKQNNPQNENNSDKNQDQNSENSNSDNQQQNDNSEPGSSDSFSSDSQSDRNDGGSSGSNGNSSDSNQGSGEGNSSSPDESSSDSRESDERPAGTPAQMSPQEASQLLKDFDEEHGERKPWKPVRGVARPEKDW